MYRLPRSTATNHIARSVGRLGALPSHFLASVNGPAIAMEPELEAARAACPRFVAWWQYAHALTERESCGAAEIGRDGGRVLWWAESGLY